MPTEPCYDYFACRRTSCPVHSVGPEINCWEIEGTLCTTDMLETLSPTLLQRLAGEEAGKGEACAACAYKARYRTDG